MSPCLDRMSSLPARMFTVLARMCMVVARMCEFLARVQPGTRGVRGGGGQGKAGASPPLVLDLGWRRLAGQGLSEAKSAKPTRRRSALDAGGAARKIRRHPRTHPVTSNNARPATPRKINRRPRPPVIQPTDDHRQPGQPPALVTTQAARQPTTRGPDMATCRRGLATRSRDMATCGRAVATRGAHVRPERSSCATGTVIMQDGTGHHARPERSACARASCATGTVSVQTGLGGRSGQCVGGGVSCQRAPGSDDPGARCLRAL